MESVQQLVDKHGPSVYRLRTSIQNYQWGSTTALAELFSWPQTGHPQAELWMGTHPAGPSAVETATGEEMTLAELISTHPEYLDAAELPFLLKVLAIEHPLSLQAHPDRDQAVSGFANENRAGISLTSPGRNYQDQHPKPELVTAVSDFGALCGFRPLSESYGVISALVSVLRDTGHGTAVAALQGLLENVQLAETSLRHGVKIDSATSQQDAGYHRLLTYVLHENRPELTEAATALVSALPQIFHALSEVDADTLSRVVASHPGDPGAFIALMLNRVTLSPGEALFVDAGVIHAYLYGVGIEVMANSNNVLRAGLTPKHVDAAELCNIADTSSSALRLCQPRKISENHHVFEPQCEYFTLHTVQVQPNVAETFSAHDAVIMLCLRGSVEVNANSTDSVGQDPLSLSPGDAVFVPARTALQFSSREGAQLYLATTGQQEIEGH